MAGFAVYKNITIVCLIIAQVKVLVLRKTVVGDWSFDYLSSIHPQSQLSEESSSEDGIYASDRGFASVSFVVRSSMGSNHSAILQSL